MTLEQAYYEREELWRKMMSWEPSGSPTAYQRAVVKRMYLLQHFLEDIGTPAPEARAQWECPEKDVEESAERFYRNYCARCKNPNMWKLGLEANKGAIFPPASWESEKADYERIRRRRHELKLRNQRH